VRSSGRIPKEVPILLIGSDLDGRVFSEHTTTVVLSLHGAGLLSKHKLSPEQELILRLPDLNKEAEIRVVGQLGSQKGSYTYGVAFFDPNLVFWDIDFPPATPAELEIGLLSLVCNSCKTLEKVDDASMEADVCATNEGVLRFCKRCNSSTLWKPLLRAMNQESVPAQASQLPLFSPPAIPASAQIPPPPSNSIPAPPLSPGSAAASLQAPAPSPAPPPAPAAPSASFYAQPYSPAQNSAPSQSTAHPARPDPASDHAGEPQAAVLTMPPPDQEKPAAQGVNRRKHPRVKVSYSACIRNQERGDDIVVCEDMSKGGLRFKSSKNYYARSLIEVAVPYQPGQPAIFVPAQIVFVEELPEQRLFRCGVQYIKATRARDYF
jgi:hypothetical protein